MAERLSRMIVAWSKADRVIAVHGSKVLMISYIVYVLRKIRW